MTAPPRAPAPASSRPSSGTRVAAPPPARRPRFRLDVVLAGALVTALLVGIAGWQVARGWRARRAEAEGRIREHAMTAAQFMADGLARHELETTLAVLAPVLATPDAAAPRALRPVSRLEDHARRTLRERALLPDSLFGVMHVDSTGRLSAVGALAAGAVPAAVRAVMARDPDVAYPRVRQWAMTVGGRAAWLVVADEHDAAGRVVARHGLLHGAARWDAHAAAKLLAKQPLLPAAFGRLDWRTGARGAPPRAPDGTPAPAGQQVMNFDDVGVNALLTIVVRDPAGAMSFAEGPGRDDPALAERGGRLANKARSVAAGFPEDRIAMLVAAAVPVAGEQWLLGGMLALCALLGGAVLVEVHRQRQLSEARRNFVAAVSHELRSPLAHMATLSDTLLAGAESAEQERRWLQAINREAHRLGRLVENVLLHARGAEREIRLQREPLDLVALVGDVVGSADAMARARGASVEATVPASCIVTADAGALRQVLTNLLDNALKYGPEGQVVSVAVRAPVPPDDVVLVTVDDEGPGIPVADRRRIWTAFERLGDRGGATGGSGLGLSVVRDLVSRHGGHVEVGTSPSGGARFVVALPAR